MSCVQFAESENVISLERPLSSTLRPKRSRPHLFLLAGDTYTSAMAYQVRLIRVKSAAPALAAMGVIRAAAHTVPARNIELKSLRMGKSSG